MRAPVAHGGYADVARRLLGVAASVGLFALACAAPQLFAGYARPWLTVFLGLVYFRVVFLAGLTAVLLRTDWARARRVFAEAPPPRQKWVELRAGVLLLAWDAALLTGLRFAPWTPAHPLEPLGLVLGFTLAFGFNEAWFFATHWLLHRPRLFFIHAQHHVARVCDPFTSVSFSLVEHVLATTPPLVVSWAMTLVLPVPIEAAALFGFVVWVGDVYAHSNLEPWPAGFTETWPGKVFATPTHHALHHARLNGHYGLYTRWLDRLFGTEFDDYAAVHARKTPAT
jgi:sterol desaturase/sphingolipid hydroxylase (fatty acid hydroxylase superfamily)